MARSRTVTTITIESPHKYTGPGDIEVQISPGACEDGCRRDIYVMTIDEGLIELHLDEDERADIIRALGGRPNA